MFGWVAAPVLELAATIIPLPEDLSFYLFWYGALILAVICSLLKILSLYLAQDVGKVTNLPIKFGLIMYAFSLYCIVGSLLEPGSDGLLAL